MKERAKGRTILTREQVFQDIFEGGMPDYVSGRFNRDAYFKQYIETYIEKDVKNLISVGNATTFRTFLSYVALRTGQEIHYDSLASAVGIDVKTLKRWLSILETSGIIVFLQPFMKNLSNRIIKAPKMYFMDTGLASYLCGWPNAEMLEKSSMAGAFFETYVVSEVVKSFMYQNEDYKRHLYFYRDIDQKEVDLIYERYQVIHPIEIKKGIAPTKPNKNFSALKKYQMPIGQGFIIDCCDKPQPIDENTWSIPVGWIG